MASRKANPVLIGAFVLGAIALSVVAALLFGSGRFFKETSRWVIYFDSSVTGLDVGAPVIFRGVPVGSVVDIAAYVDPNKDIIATPVYIEIVQGVVRVPEGVTRRPFQIIDGWIQDKGFRAQLKTQSLVTGKLYVDLDFYPETPAKLKGLDPALHEIPAVPTQLEEVERTIRAFVDRIQKMPLEEIVTKLDSAIGAAGELLSDPKLKDSIANLDGTLAEARELIGKLNSSYADLEGNLDGTLAEARELIGKLNSSYADLEGDLDATLEQATRTLANADAAISDVRGFIAPGSPLQYEMLVVLDELTQTLRSVRALFDGLTRDPNQIIFGRGEPGAQ